MCCPVCAQEEGGGKYVVTLRICCNVLQCVAVCYSENMLQCVAVCCSLLQCVAICGSVVHCVHLRSRALYRKRGRGENYMGVEVGREIECLFVLIPICTRAREYVYACMRVL